MASKKKTAAKSAAKTVYTKIKKRATKQNAMLGGRFAKNVLVEGTALTVVRRLPDFAGPWQGPIDKIIAGGGLRVLGQKHAGGSMIEVGSAEAVANLMDLYVVPTIGKALGGAVQGAGKQLEETGRYVISTSAVSA